YGILQPRIGISMASGPRSTYARLFGSEAGIDPYTRAVSDVYQDLFDEGSFIGKGIYDVDAFEGALAGRFPDDAILSHDLVEGCHARSGLVSDVQLYEDYPSTYRADATRRERWIRGDWQLLPWLLPWVPDARGRHRRNPLSALSCWKIADNLRRSLAPPALVALFLAGWLRLGAPLEWTLAVLAVPLLPSLLSAVQELLSKPRDAPWRAHLHAASRSIRRQFTRIALALAWLPHEAWVCLRAIARTLWRMLLTRRGLLEWQASSEVERAGGDDLASNWRRLAVAPLLALATALALAWQRPAVLPIALPVLLLWLAAPWLAWWASRRAPPARRELSVDQTRELRLHARKTWAFFETFVCAEDNWLPPDNLQEVPTPVIAHRTSPTNIGLALLANLAAHDFGYLGLAQLLERCGNTLRSMDKLDRHRGHFLNWYDTRTLLPLPPRYVSSVDSGNLAGHLLTLRAGLLALPDAPLRHPRLAAGLLDALLLVESTLAGSLPPPAAALRVELETEPGSSEAAQSLLQRARAIAQMLIADARAAGAAEAEAWAQALSGQCEGQLRELELLHPWLRADAGSTGRAPASLRELAELAVESLPAAELALAAPARELARQRIAEAEALAAQAGEFARMQYHFLYDDTRHLLAIGYNVDERRLDDSSYDLLASESRLASFVAIAQGQLPQEGWFALGRLLTTNADGEPVLLSWSGSMFEYLMPMLVMPSYENTLLDRTCQAVVHRQIGYARERGVPWG
ncbi:MAG: cyclic beta 1-2 glucan synthetase, partial [Arenimonas sp.]